VKNAQLNRSGGVSGDVNAGVKLCWLKLEYNFQENIQNELFRQLTDYMEKTGKSASLRF
jgi:hypothetical protein